MASDLYIFAPTRTLYGGVGSYTFKFSETFSGLKIITGCKVSQLKGRNVIKLRGFDKQPKLTTLWDLFRNFSNVERAVFIYQGSLSILLLFIMRFICRSSIHIIIFHGLASRYTSKFIYIIEWLAARFATHCIFLTEHDRKYLNVSSRYTKIPNYSEYSTAHVSDFNSSVAITVTRLGRQKNLEYNLREMSKLPLSLHVYGVTPNEVSINNKLSKLISSNVFFKGRDNAQIIYPNKFAFILSTFSEGFPLSILEAASHGLPLIVSDIPELREILGDNALYFQNNKVGDLSNKLLSLKTDINLYNEFSEKSTQISQKYNLDLWKNAWIQVLNKLQVENEKNNEV